MQDWQPDTFKKRAIMRRMARDEAFRYLRAIAAVRHNKRAKDNGKVRWDILIAQARIYAELARAAQVEARLLGWRLP